MHKKTSTNTTTTDHQVIRSKWPIIVGGCHRSGTSLVRRILNAHSNIMCGPEVKFFRDFYNSYLCEDPLRHARFSTSARSLLPESDLFEILGTAFIKLHTKSAELKQKPRWADKNPENVLYLNDWSKLLGNAWAFIHVVRNPLDTLASIKQIKFPLVIPSDLEARIEFYKTYIEQGLTFSITHPEQSYRIIYEELVSAPQKVISNLMQWLGENFELTQLNFNEHPQQTGLEDPKVSATSSVHVASVNRWRDVLTEQEAKVILQKTSDLWHRIDSQGRHLPDTSSPKNHLSKISTTNLNSSIFSKRKPYVVAIMTSYNEGDIIAHSIKKLISQGIHVYLIDNWSSDNTFQQAASFLGNGLIGLERFPFDKPTIYYEWEQLLKRKEELCMELAADWYIHQDVDEVRDSPWLNTSLLDGISIVDSLGFNCIDFLVINFKPIDDNFPPGSDMETYFHHYELGTKPAHFVQIKAWKNLGVPVDIATSGGHSVQFDGRLIYPVKFLLKHYPIRGQSHGRSKVMIDRKQRFSPTERARGWHTQYDTITKETNFITDASKLNLYDEICFKKRIYNI